MKKLSYQKKNRQHVTQNSDLFMLDESQRVAAVPSEERIGETNNESS